MSDAKRSLLSIFLLLASIARADLLPPEGEPRPVPYEIEVTGSQTDSHVLAIFPWSLSNGRPMTGVKFAVPNQPIRFGKSIDGDPAFYVVQTSKQTEAEGLPADDLETWFADTANAKECTGAAIALVHEPPRVEGAARNVDYFNVDSLNAAGCNVVTVQAPSLLQLRHEQSLEQLHHTWRSFPSSALPLLGVCAIVLRLFFCTGVKASNKE